MTISLLPSLEFIYQTTYHSLINSERLEELEKQAEFVAKQLMEYAAYFLRNTMANAGIDLNLEGKNIEEALNNILKTEILSNIKKYFNGRYVEIKKAEGVTPEFLMSDFSLHILETILNFRKGLEKVYLARPTEIAITAAVGASVTLIAASSPILALLVKTTGIIDKAQDFIRISNLENFIKNVKDKKQVRYVNQQFETIFKVVNEFNETGKNLNKTGRSLNEIFLQVNLNTDAKAKFVQSYSELSREEQNDANILLNNLAKVIKGIPADKNKIDESIKKLSEKIFEKANADNLPIKSEILEKAFNQLKENLTEQLVRHDNIFNKILIINDNVSSFMQNFSPARGISSNSQSIIDKIVREHFLGKEFENNIMDVINDSGKGGGSKLIQQLDYTPSILKGISQNYLQNEWSGRIKDGKNNNSVSTERHRG